MRCFDVLVVCAVCIQWVYTAPSQRFSFGTIEGVDVTSQTTGKPVYAYYGIPFAQPPVGELRLRAPVPYQGGSPDTVISSTSFRPACMQSSTPAFGAAFGQGDVGPMSEDCLHLNIFVPATPAAGSGVRKVMVWIHGGGFVAGQAGEHIPTDIVADYDVIVVSVQYRLGYLGFIGTGDDAVRGNNGLRDQLMGIQWVKDNIRAFGGDGDDLTVIGESAGSGCVSILSLSPYSKGVFSKVIMMSGVANAPFMVQSKDLALQAFYNTAGKLGCLPWWHSVSWGSESYHNSLAACMRLKPAQAFVAAQGFGAGGDGEGGGDFGGGDFSQPREIVLQDQGALPRSVPYIDGDFLPGKPSSLLRNRNYLQQNGILDRSYLTGTTNNEAFLQAGAVTQGNLERLIRYNTDDYFGLANNDAIKSQVEFLYSYPRAADGKPTFQGMSELSADTNFVFPCVEFVTLVNKASPSTPVYHYLIDYYPEISIGNGLVSRERGLPHAADLAFLWDTQFTFFLLNTPDAVAMTDVYRGTLSQFAKTGDPSRASTGGSPATWPRFDAAGRQYASLSAQPEVKSRVYGKRMSLWQDYLPLIANNIFTGRQRDRF